MRQFIVVCMLLFLLPFNIWGQRTSNASSSTTDSLFNDAARQYYVKKLHGEDVRELKASFNGNVTIEFGKRKHQVYNVTVIYSIYKNNEWCATHYKNWYWDLKERKCYFLSAICSVNSLFCSATTLPSAFTEAPFTNHIHVTIRFSVDTTLPATVKDRFRPLTCLDYY